MYGLEIVLGEFGAAKSYKTHKRITSWFFRKSVLIGNYTSPDFHLEFRSRADLVRVLRAIYEFKKDPRNISRKIVVVIDEAPIYFGNRDFKSFPKELLAFLVQLRKLNVYMIVIAQDLKMLDVNFRRLCFNVRKYYPFLGFLRFYRDYRLLSEDANINDPVNTEVSAPRLFLGPSITKHFRPRWLWGSTRYDTNELILPEYDIVDKDVLEKIFPDPGLCKNREQYREFCAKKRAAWPK